jgi:hypothetical protein
MSRNHRNYSLNLLTGANRGNQSVYKETPFNSKSLWNIPVTEKYTTPSYAAMPAGWNTLTHTVSSWLSGGVPTVINYTTWSDSKVNLRYWVDAWSKVDDATYARQGNLEAEEDAIYALTSTTFPFEGNTYSTINQVDPTQGDLPNSYNRLKNPASPPKQIYVPASLQLGESSDGHTVIVQPDGTYVDLYAPIELAFYGGDIVCLIYNIIDPSDTGGGWWMGNRASGIPSFGGLIRDEETWNGSNVDNGIAHALSIMIPSTYLDSAYSYQEPAVCFDRNPGYSGSIAMGAHLAIDPNVSKPSISSTIGSHIWDICVTYGVYVTDRGGGGVEWHCQPGNNETAQMNHTKFINYASSLQTALHQIRDNLSIVTET